MVVLASCGFSSSRVGCVASSLCKGGMFPKEQWQSCQLLVHGREALKDHLPESPQGPPQTSQSELESLDLPLSGLMRDDLSRMIYSSFGMLPFHLNLNVSLGAFQDDFLQTSFSEQGRTHLPCMERLC